MNNRPSKKLRILFVAGFKYPKSGLRGGQVFAAKSLVASAQSDQIEWVLLDSSQISLPPPNIVHRSTVAFIRFLKFLYLLCFKNIDGVLLFCSKDFSFLEKGLAAIIASKLGKTSMLFPRSGKDKDSMEKSGIMRWFIPMAIRNSDFLFCQSESLKAFYRSVSGVESDRIKVIKNWIDFDIYKDIPWPASHQTVRILFLGWMETHKGIWDLFEAMKLVNREFQQWELHFAGDGSKLEPLKEQVEQSDFAKSVTFHGWVDEAKKLELIAASHLFVLPSYVEGMPNALLECMASGRACIATDVGGTSELLMDSSCGTIIAAGDVQAIADSLLAYATQIEDSKKIGDNARQHIREYHSLESGTAKMMQKVVGCCSPNPS